MALTVTSGLTEYNDCDANTGWTTGSTLDTDFKVEGTGCLGDDVDVTTSHYVGPTITAINMSTTKYTIYAYMFSFTASTLDTKANGGMRIVLQDSSANQSYWYVGGSDTYKGGWEVFTCNTAVSPDANSGTACDLTDVVKMGVGFKNTVKSKLPENCFWDWIRYGTSTTAALTVYGTNTTANDGWSEIQSGDDTGVYGIIQSVAGGYKLKGPIAFGDSAGTNTTNFTDTGTTILWDDMPVGDSFYVMSIVGNATGTTDFQLGSVVGSGDDRQGVQGNTIQSLGPSWSFDCATDIADLDTIELYGCTMRGAKGGFQLDDGNKTTVISTTFLNCGAVETGGTNNGAEILNTFFIDPEGTTNNYGLQFDQTPSAGTMNTNVKQCNFITSGTPTTQYMVVFPYSGDYTVGFTDMQVFGSFTSGTLWHGRNTGTDADVTISATGTSNFATAEFDNTDVTGPDTGSVTVSASVPVTITVVDTNNNPIQNVQTSVYLTADDSQVMNELTNASGIATENFTGTTPAGCYIRARKNSTGSTRYFNGSTTGTIASGTGLSVQMVLIEDTIASA